MRIAVPRERRAHETRVAASPDTVTRLTGQGIEVVVESGAGAAASFLDEAYRAAGATVAPDAAAALAGADVVFKVQRPLVAGEGEIDELALIPRGAVLIGMLSPFAAREHVAAYAAHGLTSFSLELLPRITRAQSMDVLSSQANLAGYKAVLDAAAEFGRALPQMMTAAGTIAPARVVVLGAGVAGLQAIATARRLGARVSAFDVRRAAKEQVESLGATFVEVDATADAETAGGYAKEMDEAYRRKQAAKLHEHLKTQDIAICTALVFGRGAPRLITAEMVADMKPGSVIVDLAVEQGGNCELSEPGRIVRKHNVTIIGHLNVPGRIPVDASALYARNLMNFMGLLVDKETKGLRIDWEDEIIKATALTRDGAVVHPSFAAG
ncbi:MAG: Re/Si-specific NAD(P)(+) transhydrogenase subunit alpha [Rhodospirillaceae bacterium]|nr:Re/Si-specific NAD(P)(+) transhydrogenase subunit alpha [Rhodospirillaceae bacterium]